MSRRVSLFILILLPLLATAACGSRYPSDLALEEKFRAREADFVRLVRMFKEDSGLMSVDGSFAYSSYSTKTTLPRDRMSEYQTLLKRLEVIEVRRGWDGNVYLKVWHKNAIPVGGSYKFYVHAQQSPSPLVDSLDKLARSGQDALAYKKISENWYQCLDIW